MKVIVDDKIPFIKEAIEKIADEVVYAPGKDFTPSTLSAGSTSLDTEEQELSAHNSIRLSGKETKLMKLLMLHNGKPLSTSYIFQKIWSGEEGVDESVVWIYISYLREKLSAINSDLAIAGEEGKDFKLTLREEP